MAKKKKSVFQNRPMMLPSASTPSFLFRVPFNPKVRQVKKKLKNRSIIADSTLMKRKDAITHSAITVKKSPEAKLTLAILFRSTFFSLLRKTL